MNVTAPPGADKAPDFAQVSRGQPFTAERSLPVWLLDLFGYIFSSQHNPVVVGFPQGGCPKFSIREIPTAMIK